MPIARPAERRPAGGWPELKIGSFLNNIKGAQSKEFPVREEEVQVLHGFDAAEKARSYLTGDLGRNEVAEGLKPFPETGPGARIYAAA